MTIKEGDEVDFEGKIYTVMGIYPSSVLLKLKDGKKLFMTGMNFLETLYKRNEAIS